MNLPLETILYSLFVLILFISIVIWIRFKSKKPKQIPINTRAIIEALGSDNIVGVSFKRDKVNVQVKAHQKVQLQALKEAGCVGINVVGDTIKYYLDKDNETHYKALLAELERK